MRFIVRSTCLAFLMTSAAALYAGQASAQLANLVPSRVGGTLATRPTSGALMLVNRRTDNRVGYAERSGFAGAGWWKWDLWKLNVGIGNGASPIVNMVAAPVVLVKSDGRALVVARATDNALYTCEEPKESNDWVRMPTTTSTGGAAPAFTARPALVRRTDATVAVYAMDVSGNVWESTQNGASFNRWTSLSRPNGVTLRNSPVLAMMSNGAYLLLAAGTNNRLYARMQAGGVWGGWTDLAGAVGPNDAIAAGINSNGRVSVFVNNTSNTISLITQTAANANTWTAWTTLSGTESGQSRPAVAVQGDGRLALFFYTPNGSNLYWRVQTAASSTSWSAWSNLQAGGATSAPAAITDLNGVIHLVVAGTGGYYYERAQTAANATTWTTLGSGYLGGPYTAP